MGPNTRIKADEQHARRPPNPNTIVPPVVVRSVATNQVNLSANECRKSQRQRQAPKLGSTGELSHYWN